MVFDTMVLAYALLRTSAFYEASALALDSVDEVWAPDSLRAELINTFWQWVATRTVPMEIAQLALQDADRVVTHFVPTNALWEDALELAVARKHPAYDTLFVALAASSGVKVVTYDGPLLLKFPEWTISVPDFLGI
ncbi:MAG TPA: type II toxin-antitoxin system VapC family toxin [Thermoanaerobaculia bacterium]|nr:type II toxin-antitoxin system VapC family toxin [Thermoanaerobaculia bacterium]